MRGFRPASPLSQVGFQCLLASHIHFPASLGSTVTTRFPATTDALTSSRRLFGPCGHEHRSDPVRKFTACLRQHFPSFCLQAQSMRLSGFSMLSPVFPPNRLAWASISQLFPSGTWAASSRLRDYYAHSPVISRRIEFTAWFLQTTSLRTDGSRPVALHGQITLPQLLSVAGWLTFA